MRSGHAVARELSGAVAAGASMPFEILDVAFVLLCFIEGLERPQVAALPGGRVFLARIQAELTGFEFAYHGDPTSTNK
jgi:hypothetical protein